MIGLALAAALAGEVVMSQRAEPITLRAQPAADRAAIERDYKQLSFSPGADRPAAMGFSLIVPKDWAAVPGAAPAPTGETPVRIIGQVRPRAAPDGDVAEIVVAAMRLEREVAPADALAAYLDAKGGYRVRETRRFPTSYGAVADLVADAGGGRAGGAGAGAERHSRLIATKDGPFVYVLEASVAEDAARAGAYDDAFALAVTGFTLTDPTRARFAEPFDWRAVGPGARAVVPDAWTPVSLPTGPDEAVGAAAQSATGASIAFAGTDDPEALKRVATALIAALPKGVGTPKLDADSAPVVLDSGAPGWTLARYRSERAGVALSVVTATKDGLGVVMVSPGPRAQEGVWAHARRVMDVALETFGPAPRQP